jgi:nicotinamide mononucleotide transporter
MDFQALQSGVILTTRALIWNFPVNIVACILSLLLFWQSKLYADALLQIFFLVFVLFGWWNWLRPQPETKAELPISRTPSPTLLIGILIAAVCGLGWGIGLDKYTDASLPYADAQVAAFSIFGQWLVARKWIENWPIWIGVDILASRIFWVKGLPLYSLLYAFFCVLAIIGYLQWRKQLKHA